ncbi:Di-copper centre-containing protein [Corynespora cassiicola Philippines]|uniref:tyrosinase n=1 Tax=Corynespora cassiicola Philippines TaxID=1448308 RepID=A0A2T2NGW5_CORCC|nr:Di-copper centre-containing protein [Corynespora cassiicola Philippines]
MPSWVQSGVHRLLFIVASFPSTSFTLPLSLDFLEDSFAQPDSEPKPELYAVQGIPGFGDTTPHPRLEIRELQKNADQWNIYLLGLQRFQSMSQSEMLSYYQIAGVHGRPFISWDGVGQADGGGGGYCTHGSNLFPTWHRPYLALFESAIYSNARDAIAEFPEGDLKDRSNAALATFRMPYWDWATVPPSGEGTLPSSLSSPTIDVKLPNGTKSIPNPLFSYSFHPINTNDFPSSPWNTWPGTLRDPNSLQSSAVSRVDNVAKDLDAVRPNLQSRIYNLLSMQHNYTLISDNQQSGDSLESTHDTVHNVIGSGGHMSALAYSAFDPIFWLHHTNVDRIFAMWQALNPDSYVEPVRNPNPTFTTPGNSIGDAKSPLTPFHKDTSGTFWNSEDVRSTTTFGYTYPELSSSDTPSLTSRVNALYGPSAGSTSSTSTSNNTSDDDDDDDDEEESTKRDLFPSLHHMLSAPTFAHKRQYIASIRAHKFGLDGSFSVYVFLGDKPAAESPGPGAWASDPCFVGMSGVLSQGGVSDEEGGYQEVVGSVPLTAALEERVKRGELESMEEGVVRRYLEERLRWYVRKTGGEEVAVKDTPGFQLKVLQAEVEPAESEDAFPTMKADFDTLMEMMDGVSSAFLQGGWIGAF